MELEKVAKIDLEEEAYLKPISDRDIGFYNLDKNTAQFQFVVSKNDKPLLISAENVKGYAFFKANNGSGRSSTSGVIDVEFIDPMRGLIGVKVPQWFLKNVANMEVLGEVYLSLNDNKNKGKDDTVVLGTFKFSVRDSLVNQIESDIKVSYIRMFDDLRDLIQQKVEDLKNDIQSTSSMLEAIKQTINTAVSSVNKATNDGVSKVNSTTSTAIGKIDDQTSTALSQIDNKKNDVESGFGIAQNAFDTNVSQNIQSFDEKVTSANTSLDEKINNLQALGALTKEDVDALLKTYAWQKYQLTNDSGYIKTIMDQIDLSTMIGLENTGYYYLANAINVPENRGKYGYVTIVNQGINAGYGIYREFNSNILFINIRYNNIWKGWQRINQSFTDTGWIDLQLVNGATPSTNSITGGFNNAYRIVTHGTVTKKMIRINATTIKHGQTIAILPKDFVKQSQIVQTGVPKDKYGGRITLNTSGTIDFSAMYDSTTWSDADYIYTQYEWTE